MYRLFYFPRNASWAPHMVLKEIGAEYQLELVDRKSQQQKSADYLQLNPTGRIPTFVDGKQIIQESAAICIHLAEKYPAAKLIPEVNSPDRAVFFQWMFYLTTSIQSELMLYFYPDKHVSDTTIAKTVSETQQQRVTEMFAHVDKYLKGRSYLIGEQLTVCDLFCLCFPIGPVVLKKHR